MHGIRPEALSNEELTKYAYLLETNDPDTLRQWLNVLTDRLTAQLDDTK